MRALQLLSFHPSTKPISSIIYFSFPLFFLILADSTMSYIFPIILEQTTNSNTLLGLILGFSSMVGIITDFLLPQLIKGKTWKFQLIAAIVLSVMFPLAMYLGSTYALIIFFLIASLMWGIYFEFMSFAQQTFVVTEENPRSYSKDWGILYLLYQLTAILGPIIGSFFLRQDLLISIFIIIFFQILSFIFMIVISGKLTSKNPTEKIHGVRSTLHLLKEFKYWEVIGVRVWPAITMGITISIVNSVFWTIGGLFGEVLFPNQNLDWLVVVLFFGPMIIGSVMLTRLKITKYKKRLSQISLLLGSLCLILISVFRTSDILILLTIVVASVLISFAQPLNEAVYSDLLDRIGKSKLHLLGIARANTSVAYIVGPIVVGILADKTDYYTTFSIVGIFSAIVALILIIFSPRKLKLPHKALELMEAK